MIKGVDISKYNGTVDFNRLKNSGIDFVIIHTGYGQNLKSQDDRMFERFYQGAKNAGLYIGVYIYSYAKTVEMAEGEADHVLRQLRGKQLDLPVYYDLEDPTIMHVNWNKTADAFCKKIEKAGKSAGIYLSSSCLNKISEIKNKYTLWVAKWGKNNNGMSITNPQYDMWQYTARGKVAGISGYCDMNVLNRDLIYQLSGRKTETVKTKTGRNKTIETLALETLKGKYGDGEERKKKLGENYSKVQKKINSCYELVTKVKQGVYGNGDERKKALGKNYKIVQYIINKGE